MTLRPFNTGLVAAGGMMLISRKAPADDFPWVSFTTSLPRARCNSKYRLDAADI
jgi:hypothetical protein